MTEKSTSVFFSKIGMWWWFLLVISSDLVSAYPLRESREAVDLVDAVQQEVCSARAKLRSLYKTFHDDYASASRNGTPAAGSFSLPNLRAEIVRRGARVEISNCPSACPSTEGSMVQWCVRLASSSHNTTTCLSDDGYVVSQSPISKQIGLADYLEVEMAPDGGPPKLVVKETTALFSYALMSCIVTTPTCKDISNTYISLQTPPTRTPLAVREAPPQQVFFTEGDEVTLKCVFEAGTYGHGVYWFNEEDTFVGVISEDPRCETCTRDQTIPEDDARRSAPVRAYFYQEKVSSCPDTMFNSIGELIINTSLVDIADGTTFTCAGSYYHHNTRVSYSTRLWRMEFKDTNTSTGVDNNNTTSIANWTAECRSSNSLAVIDDPMNLTGEWSHNGGEPVRERPAGSTCEADEEVFAIKQYTRDSHSAHLVNTLVACGVPYSKVNEYRCDPGFMEAHN